MAEAGSLGSFWSVPGLVIAIVTWLLTILTNVTTHGLRIIFRGPHLLPTFDGKEDCCTLTPISVPTEPSAFGTQAVTIPVFFARIRVKNEKPIIAEKCRGYLTGIEELIDGEWKSSEFNESLPLVWAYEPESPSVDIPYGITRHIDVLVVRDDIPGFQPQLRSASGVVFVPLRFKPLFEKYGKFRFSVLISAQEIKPLPCQITLSWDGIWPPKFS
jgi:hypothetical protein